MITPKAEDVVAQIPDAVAALLRTPFDLVLSDPVRLRLAAALCGLPNEAAMGFTGLRRALGLSDGNLGAHLAILVDAGYAGATPTWSGKRRVTRYTATSSGRAAFEQHVRALESVIESAHHGGRPSRSVPGTAGEDPSVSPWDEPSSGCG